MSDQRENLQPPSAARFAALRVIDANFNRAAEGLRVVEEHCRFALDDAHLTGVCKSLRHRLAETLSPLSGELLAARDSARDVGTGVTTESEGRRGSEEDVVAANVRRVQQAMRCLEEYGKLIAPAIGASVEAIRYRAYTLEKAIGSTVRGRQMLKDARLYVLIDGRGSEGEFETLAQSLIDAGTHILQLRDKRLSERELLGRARRLRQLTRGSNTLFIMNDRADLAALSDADGLHLGQDDLNVSEARRIVGAKMMVGVSTHSLVQAKRAVDDGANYLGLGPTFPSSTKEFDSFTGLELLRTAAENVSLPAFAIGGIKLENIRSVFSAGVRRVAVSGAVCGASNPASQAKRLLAALETFRSD